jgi:hypothetical protein
VHHHGDAEDGKALPQGRAIHSERTVVAVGRIQRQHPPEQWGKTVLHHEAAAFVAAFGPAFVGGIAVPVAQLFARRRV